MLSPFVLVQCEFRSSDGPSVSVGVSVNFSTDICRKKKKKNRCLLVKSVIVSIITSLHKPTCACGEVNRWWKMHHIFIPDANTF